MALKTIFLDSMILIAAVKEKDEFKGSAEFLLQKINDGKYEAFASVISLSELSYVLKGLKFSNEKINSSIHSVLSINNITFLPLTVNIFKQASDFILAYKTGLNDSIITSTMFHTSIREIVTEDADFDKFPFIKRLKFDDLI